MATVKSGFNMDSIKGWMESNRITEVECLFPDFTGNARGKIIPANKFLREGGMRLPEVIFTQTVTGEYPDDDSMIDPLERDMQLYPDPNTIRFVPWALEPTAQVIHDCFDVNGKLIDIAPRSVLRRVLSFYEKQGWKPVVAPELEFYLVTRNEDPDYPLVPPVGRNGRPETARQSFSIDAVNEFDPIFEDMYDYCEAQELEVDTLIHESGAAQMEINFLHGDAIDLADQVFLFKRTMREAAHRHGIYATFMAKPMSNEPGSAMHIHQSLEDMDGNNLFGTSEGGQLRSVHAFHRRPAEIHPGSDRPAGAERQLLPPPHLWRECAAQRAVGGGKPHLRPAGPLLRTERTPGREPLRRGRCQSVSGSGRHPGLRLPRHAGEARTHAGDEGECL